MRLEIEGGIWLASGDEFIAAWALFVIDEKNDIVSGCVGSQVW
jgi:hypothetical protein